MDKQYAAIGLALLLLLAVSPAPSDDSSLTNDDVLRLTAAGLGTDVIIAKIQMTATAFDTSEDRLRALKEAGVEDSVLAVMIDKGAAAPSCPPGRDCKIVEDPEYYPGEFA